MSDTLNFTVSGDDMQKRSDEITVGVDRAPGEVCYTPPGWSRTRKI
ncbi:hypothetical protein [Secundilactobacillus kimchicus]